MTGDPTRYCEGPAETRAVAARLAPILEPGDVIILEGDLGAGKTTFVQGLAEALGVDVDVTSPTFTLMNIYRAPRFDLVHVDVYRLERLSEVEDLAMPELLEDGAVAVVEWGERAAAALPAERLWVTIAPGSSDGDRIVRFAPEGRSWQSRRDRLTALVTAGR